MNISTGNFTTPAASTNSTTDIRLLESLEMCAYSICFLFGLPTHSYIIWLIVTGTGSGVASEFFNLNLSVCEIGNSINAVFGLLSHFSSLFKILTDFVQGLSITGRPLFQCLMCVERYLAVVHPVTFLKYKPLRYRVICCTAVWIITLGSCLFCIFSASVNREAYVWFFSTVFLLYFSIQLFCLVAVLRALKQSGPGERGREREEKKNMKKRAFFLILLTTVNMIIQNVPFTITGLYIILTKQEINDYWFPAFVCYVLTGFLQPFLYLQRTGKLFCLCSS
ncbi:chemokine XC receptor 1-like [Rhinichthys klamathensis goyatoka]|uniref:chemokine XC receptor 1-like n=1 Tax=Rhinichthys klamathensis goyatoka TaxID=3034132 RepID=UPI0024B5E4A1|nr:chemokine XC receptor 1-like [Rhinichthys klamathensis goyatoka]